MIKTAYPEDIQNLNVELEKTLLEFKEVCLTEKDCRVVREIKRKIEEKFSLQFDYCGFYYRQYDRLSKTFSGDYESSLKYKFERTLNEFYCDHLLITEDAQALLKETLESKLKLSPDYVFKTFTALVYQYKLRPPLSMISCHFGGPIESMLDLKNAHSINQIKFSKNFWNYLVEIGVQFNSRSIFEIIDAASLDWERKNLRWIDDYIINNKSLKVSFNYKKSNDRWYVSRPFARSGWDNRGEYPKGHPFFGGRRPIIGVRQDDCLSYVSSTINFSSIFENYIREKLKLPRIGEGQWISEVALLNKVRKLTAKVVIHQWSPAWLGRQRIDIGVPDLNIAIEYNGKQHYEPVAFFGGNNGYKRTIERDKKKEMLCQKNKVKLIIIKYDETEEEIDIKLKEIFF